MKTKFSLSFLGKKKREEEERRREKKRKKKSEGMEKYGTCMETMILV